MDLGGVEGMSWEQIMFQILCMKSSELSKQFFMTSKSINRFYVSQVAFIPFLKNVLYMSDPDLTQPNLTGNCM